jgi:hypothetical protein
MAERIRKLYDKPLVAADLREWGSQLDQPEKILGLYLASEQELVKFLENVVLITDDTPYTEFPLWRWRAKGGEYHQLLTPTLLRNYLKDRSASQTPP